MLGSLEPLFDERMYFVKVSLTRFYDSHVPCTVPTRVYLSPKEPFSSPISHNWFYRHLPISRSPQTTPVHNVFFPSTGKTLLFSIHFSDEYTLSPCLPYWLLGGRGASETRFSRLTTLSTFGSKPLRSHSFVSRTYGVRVSHPLRSICDFSPVSPPTVVSLHLILLLVFYFRIRLELKFETVNNRYRKTGQMNWRDW